MLSIDEAIAQEKEMARIFETNVFVAEYHKQHAEWLEELKANKVTSAEVYEQGYKRGYKNGYNKAIDDFTYACDKKCGFYSGINKQLKRDMLLEIAEQLKAGGENV